REIRQFSSRADPDVELPAGNFLAEVSLELDWPQFDRTLALIVTPHRVRHRREQFFAHIGIARKFFRWRYIRHLGLMVEAGLIAVERYQHRKDRVPVLARSDPPRRETLAVPDAVDVVDDRNLGVSRQQEVSVHRMRRTVIDGSHRGDQRLPDHLSPENTLPANLR